ncbi:MAG: RDD family protein, partial [Verrucomicrobiota bacterium]
TKPANGGGPTDSSPPQPPSPPPGGLSTLGPQPSEPVTLNAMTSTPSISETIPPPIPSSSALGAAAAATFPPFTDSSSQPALASAELASLPRVGFWPRLAASLLDILMLAIVNACTFRSVQFFFLLMVAYHVGLWAWKGTTLGGIVLAVRVVRLDGRPLDWPVALVRAFSCLVSLAAFGLGFFWASWTNERQSWHDMIAGTTIVKLAKTVPLI